MIRELAYNILQLVDLALYILLPDGVAFQDHLQAFIHRAGQATFLASCTRWLGVSHVAFYLLFLLRNMTESVAVLMVFHCADCEFFIPDESPHYQ